VLRAAASYPPQCQRKSVYPLTFKILYIYKVIPEVYYFFYVFLFLFFFKLLYYYNIILLFLLFLIFFIIYYYNIIILYTVLYTVKLLN